MLSLLILIIFGLGMTFFATQNTGSVHILFGNYVLYGIPLYIVVIGSLLLGIFASWLISLVDAFSSTLTLHWKDSQIKNAYKTIETLRKEKHDLEIENSRLLVMTEDNKEQETSKSVSEEKILSPNLGHSFSF